MTRGVTGNMSTPQSRFRPSFRDATAMRLKFIWTATLPKNQRVQVMKKISAKDATRLARNYPLSVRWSDEDQVSSAPFPASSVSAAMATRRRK